MCPSSGETTVFMQHLVLVILCGWLSGMQTRQSSTQTNKYQLSHKYGCFSWWWAHGRPKHVQKRNKHTKKNFTPSWLYLQDYTWMHNQENLKFYIFVTHCASLKPYWPSVIMSRLCSECVFANNSKLNIYLLSYLQYSCDSVLKKLVHSLCGRWIKWKLHRGTGIYH